MRSQCTFLFLSGILLMCCHGSLLGQNSELTEGNLKRVLQGTASEVYVGINYADPGQFVYFQDNIVDTLHSDFGICIGICRELHPSRFHYYQYEMGLSLQRFKGQNEKFTCLEYSLLGNIGVTPFNFLSLEAGLGLDYPLQMYTRGRNNDGGAWKMEVSLIYNIAFKIYVTRKLGFGVRYANHFSNKSVTKVLLGATPYYKDYSPKVFSMNLYWIFNENQRLVTDQKNYRKYW